MKRSLLILTIAIAVVVSVYFFKRSPNPAQEQEGKVMSAESIIHGHGLAVDVANPNRVYIATHHGLFLLENDRDLTQLGTSNDDFMGFTQHPSESKIFYSSGHPSRGGNIGFQKSEDGGLTWQKVSSGLNGPVDFHALAISPVNPNLVYGWYRGELQRSSDAGQSWAAFPTSFPIIQLAADPKDENLVYAATAQGLLKSADKGESWQTLFSGVVRAIAINPETENLITFSEHYGFAQSADQGKNWTAIPLDLDKEAVQFIAHSRTEPQVVYLLTEKNRIYKSTDSGNTWVKIF